MKHCICKYPTTQESRYKSGRYYDFSALEKLRLHRDRTMDVGGMRIIKGKELKCENKMAR